MMIIVAVVIISCGFGVKPNNNSQPAITINNSTAIPIFDDTPTISTIRIHNNSSHAINGIKYTINNQFQLDQNSVQLCETIQANNYCDLTFITPNLQYSMDVGYAIITAKYNLGQTTVKQILTYKKLTNQVDGINFVTDIFKNDFNQINNYATIYFYNHSSIGTKYHIDKIITKNNNFLITKANIIDNDVEYNSVSAIEITPANTNSNDVITIFSHNINSDNIITSSIEVANSPMGNMAILIANSSIIDSSIINPTVFVTITNIGNESATIGNVTTNNPNISITNCGNGTKIAPMNTCTMNITTPNSSGNATISIPYSSFSIANQLIQPYIQWVNSQQTALLGIQFSANPLLIRKNIVAESFSAIIKNVGGYPINLPATNAINISKITGNAIIDTPNPTGCNNRTLAINQTCTINITVRNNNIEDNKYILFQIFATYNNQSTVESYTKNTVLLYNTI